MPLSLSCLNGIPENIILSRTDSIGDTVLCLPMAKVLKDHFPAVKIGYLGKEYTRSVIEACTYIDHFIELEDFLHKPVHIAGRPPQCIIHVLPKRAVAARAKQLKIPLRIGTTNRLYHWTTCNKLIRLSRKNSPLHEAQLNLKLLKPLGVADDLSLQTIGQSYGLQPTQPLPEPVADLIELDKYNLILQTRSKGNGREWGLPNFVQLIKSLDQQVFRIFISGTKEERASIQPLFDEAGDLVTDLTGRLTLEQLLSFISRCDGMVASGTGPIHLAAALGIDALGLYPPLHPIHPGRWKPLGPKARFFVVNRSCSDCKGMRAPCHCINDISWKEIKDELDKRAAAKRAFFEIAK